MTSVSFISNHTTIDGVMITAQRLKYDISIKPKTHIVNDWKYIIRSVNELLSKITPDRKVHIIQRDRLLDQGECSHYSCEHFSITLHSSFIWNDRDFRDPEKAISEMISRRYSLETVVKVNTTDMSDGNYLFYGDRRGSTGLESSYFCPHFITVEAFKNYVRVSDPVVEDRLSELFRKVYLPKSENNYHDNQSDVFMRRVDGYDLVFGIDKIYDRIAILDTSVHPQSIADFFAESLRNLHSRVEYIILHINGIEYRAKVVPYYK